MKKLLLLLAAACCIASCAEIRTTYIGKAYPTTGTAPELYFDWKDVPSDYETMGSIKATPFGKTLEEAQALIEQIGREAFSDIDVSVVHILRNTLSYLSSGNCGSTDEMSVMTYNYYVSQIDENNAI